MIYFAYQGADTGLRQAADFCNALYQSQEFWDRIAAIGTFDESAIPATQIVSKLRSCGSVTEIRHWKPGFFNSLRYRKTVALTDPDRAYLIAYHTRFLGNPVARKVNTLVHEHVHNVDFFSDGNGSIEYGHGDQSSDGKQNTAPYRIGAIAQQFYEAANPASAAKAMAEPAPAEECRFGQDVGHIADDELE